MQQSQPPVSLRECLPAFAQPLAPCIMLAARIDEGTGKSDMSAFIDMGERPHEDVIASLAVLKLMYMGICQGYASARGVADQDVHNEVSTVIERMRPRGAQGG